MHGLIRGGISHQTYDFIAGSFIVFIVFMILLHVYLKRQHRKWLDDRQTRLNEYESGWYNEQW